MRGALISGLSCATCSASARRAACRIAGRPSWPRFWRSCAPPDAGWSRFPHGTHSSRLCAGFRHRSPPPATPQRRPLTPRAVRARNGPFTPWGRIEQALTSQPCGKPPSLQNPATLRLCHSHRSARRLVSPGRNCRSLSHICRLQER